MSLKVVSEGFCFVEGGVIMILKIRLGDIYIGLIFEFFGIFYIFYFWGNSSFLEKRFLDKWGIVVLRFKFKRFRKDYNV